MGRALTVKEEWVGWPWLVVPSSWACMWMLELIEWQLLHADAGKDAALDAGALMSNAPRSLPPSKEGQAVVQDAAAAAMPAWDALPEVPWVGDGDTAPKSDPWVSPTGVDTDPWVICPAPLAIPAVAATAAACSW